MEASNNNELHDQLSRLYGDPEIELRYFQVGPFTRASENSRDVEGYAALFNKVTTIGWYDEVILSGAFDGVLNISDIRALFNHDPNHLLARKRPADVTGIQNTLTTWTDTTGLKYGFTVPNTRDDILEMIDRGDLAELSFAFTILDAQWDVADGRDLRSIKKFKRIYNVSPVTYPAYHDTTVAKRSFNLYQRELSEDDIKAQAEKIKLRGRKLYLLQNSFK